MATYFKWIPLDLNKAAAVGKEGEIALFQYITLTPVYAPPSLVAGHYINPARLRRERRGGRVKLECAAVGERR